MMEPDCPLCGGPMAGELYDGHYGTSLDLDVCHACNALWFDQRESQRLTPDATVQLINSMQARRDRAQAPQRADPRCLRCQGPLKETFDRVKGQVVSYFACPQGCGRVLTFVQFLKEKQYVRDATQAELAALKASVKQVNCASCGAPVDLAAETRCGHCQAPVAFLDAQNLGALLAGLQVPEANSEQMAQAATDVERLLKESSRRPSADPVGEGLLALLDLLKR